MTTEKLHKVLAAAGLGSRREIEKWIAAGRLTVDGEVAVTGIRVAPDAVIELDGEALLLQAAPKTRVLVYHKPLGEICTRADPAGRPTVFDRMPRVAGRWISVGRLDVNTTGLLLLTNDGLLASRLMHPSAGLEREYIVRVHGAPGPEQLERVRRGVVIDGVAARFETLAPFRLKRAAKNQWFTVTLREGRNREVRRLWESIGCQVNQLKRVRFGPVRLPRDLPPGRWRELGPDAVGRLRRRVDAN